MSVASKVKARVKTLTADEWIIALTTAGIILPEYFFAALICVVSLTALIHPVKRSGMMEQPGFFTALLLLPVVLIPVLFSGSVQSLIYGAVLWLIIIFMYYSASVMTVRFLGNIFDLLLLISVAASAIGVVDHFFIGTMHDGVLRTTSIFENANHYGYAIELFSVIAVGRYMKTKKPLYILVCVINIASLLLCDCRTAWVAVFAAIAAMLLFTSRNWRAIAITAFVSLVVCTAAFFILPLISPRFELSRILVSYNNRSAMWHNAVEWIKKNPLFGYGTGSYEMLSTKAGVRVLKHAHNLPLNMLLDLGVIGSTVFTMVMLGAIKPVFVRNFRNKYNYISSVILGTVVATLIHGTVDVPVLGISTAFIYVLTLSSNSIKRNEASYGYALVPEKHSSASAGTSPVAAGAPGWSFSSMDSSALKKAERTSVYTMSNDNHSMYRF